MLHLIQDIIQAVKTSLAFLERRSFAITFVKVCWNSSERTWSVGRIFGS